MKDRRLFRRVTIAIAVTVIVAGLLALVAASKILLVRGEDVVIVSGDVSLAATLARPRRGMGPFPAIVIVHGSGRVTRDDLRAYGGQFAPEGMAVLFYDKRGVGESTGRFRPFRVVDCEATMHELAADVLAAVDYLKTRPDIDASRIGLLGGSQAGWVMPLAAAQSDDVAFIVSLSGPAVTCGQVVEYQRLTGVDRGARVGVPDERMLQRVDEFAGPHGYDPIPVLENVSVPMLWILGAQDAHVPTTLTATLVKRLVDAGHTNHTVEISPNADHDLHHAATGRLIDPRPSIVAWLESIRVLRP